MTRIVVAGGFLGAGKTSLILRAARMLRDKGLRVGIVTNDQSNDLVDTQLAEAEGFKVGEVAGGCFCCRFDDLVREFDALSADEADVIFAEPVGSCTDIVATVIRPLKKLFGECFEVAPFSVLVDPTRDLGEMDKLICYLYRQQLSEADMIVVTKNDLVPDGVELVRGRFAGVLPERFTFSVCSRTGDGIDGWLEAVLGTTSQQRSSISLDYELYAKAEAALGWLNLSARWIHQEGATLQAIGEPLLKQLQDECKGASLHAAHVKIMLKSDMSKARGGFTSNAGPCVWDDAGTDAVSRTGDLFVNARAEGSPERLSTAVQAAIYGAARSLGVNLTNVRIDCFSPKPPRPTHRLNSRGMPVSLAEASPD